LGPSDEIDVLKIYFTFRDRTADSNG